MSPRDAMVDVDVIIVCERSNVPCRTLCMCFSATTFSEGAAGAPHRRAGMAGTPLHKAPEGTASPLNTKDNGASCALA